MSFQSSAPFNFSNNLKIFHIGRVEATFAEKPQDAVNLTLSTSPTSGESKQLRPLKPFSTDAFSSVSAKGKKYSLK